MAKQTYTFEQKLLEFNPIICRLLARVPFGSGNHVRALSDLEVATGAGLSIPEIVHIYRSPNWDNIKTSDMFKFLKGCGINLDDRYWFKKNMRIMRTMKKAPRYLTVSPEWKTTFVPLLKLYARINNG